eukprot:6315052-Ditylum_brightwellii.AAC.1
MAFASRVRTGEFGKGNQVCHGSVDRPTEGRWRKPAATRPATAPTPPEIQKRRPTTGATAGGAN